MTGTGFAASQAAFEQVTGWLAEPGTALLEHGELESRLQASARELIRALLQDHLDLRAGREERLAQVTDAGQVPRRAAEPGRGRALATVFGPVTVRRIAYRARGHPDLHPADGLLNLPPGRHSHGLARLAATEAARGSYDDATAAITRATGQKIAKRQAEELTAAAAADFADFYATRRPPPGASPGDLLVLSCDAKGIVMRPGDLRRDAARAAARATAKQATRLSRGEVRHHKRMAEVGAVYDAAPAPRTAASIMTGPGRQHTPAGPGPAAARKWLTASVTSDAAAAVAAIFDEADRRDPARTRTWIAVVDGNNHQIRRIRAEAAARSTSITIICDFIHVLEYLWRAAWCFYPEASPQAGDWVRRQATTILHGHPTRVAGAIRRKTTTSPALTRTKRRDAEKTAAYLTSKAPYLNYPAALEHGWPISTGIIEGACRHLVKDRMDITGARWSLTGAEAILQLRALRANHDLDDYWHYHLTREKERNHHSHYHNGTIPHAA